MEKIPYHFAIDGNEANVMERVGSNVYAYEILNHLHQLISKTNQVQCTILLSSKPLADMPRTRKNWRYKVVTPTKLWTQWALPIHLFLNRNTYDVLYTPGHYAPRASMIPYVSTVMDVAFLHFPKQFKKRDLRQLQNWTAYSVKHAQKVVAISKHTKHDVQVLYKKEAKDIVVIPPAVKPLLIHPKNSDAEKICQQFKISGPYFVSVGTLQPRKNLEKLIEAFERICKETKKNLPQLVFVGKTGWLADSLLAKIKASSYSKQILVTGYVSELEKHTLVKFAMASVNVGLYEGFGIPPLEAMQLGTIPVVSNSSSLPEVVGKAGIMVDPTSAESIATGLNKVMHLSARVKGNLRKHARNQLKQFTWESSAGSVLKLLREVADGNR